MEFTEAITNEFDSILEDNSDEEGLLNNMTTWSREDLVKIKQLVDFIIVEKRKLDDSHEK